MDRYESETQVYKCIWRSLALAVLILASTIGGCTAMEVVREADIKRLQLEANPNVVINAEARDILYREIDNEDERFRRLWSGANSRYIAGEFEKLVQVRQMQLLDRAMRYRIYLQEYQLRNNSDSNGIQLSLPTKSEDIEKELKKLRQGIDALMAKKE